MSNKVLFTAKVRFSAVKDKIGYKTTYRGKITITDSLGKYGETLPCHRTNVQDAITDARFFYRDNYTDIQPAH